MTKSKSSKKSIKKQPSNNNLVYVLIAVALIFVATLGYKALYPAPSAQPAGINEIAPAGVGTAKLAIVPVTAPASGLYSLSAKTPMKITIEGATGSKLVAATVELTYDPTKMVITDLAKGAFFTNTFSAPVIDPATKKATFSFAVSPADGGKTGSGDLATFNVQPIVSGPMDISFAAATNVRAEGIETNILAVADTLTISGQPIMTTYNLDAKTNVITVVLDNDSQPTDRINVYKLASVSPLNIGSATVQEWAYENNTQVARLATVTTQPSPIITLQMTAKQVSAAGSFVVAYTRKQTDGKYKILDQRVVTKDVRVASDIVYDSNVPTDVVNAQDYVQFVVDFGKTSTTKGWIRSDINTDGVVSIADYPTFVREWGL